MWGTSLFQLHALLISLFCRFFRLLQFYVEKNFASINSGGKKRDWYPAFSFPQCPLPCVAKVLAETDAAIFRCVPKKRCTSFSKLFTCKSLSKKLYAQILINLLFFCKICRTLFLRASFNAEAVARRRSVKKVFLEI